MAGRLINNLDIQTQSVSLATKLPRTRRMLANVRTGKAKGIMLCPGDSTTYASQAGGAGVNTRKKGWPYRLSQMLTTIGVKARSDGFWGGGAAGPTLASFMTDHGSMSAGAAWALNGSMSVGGRFLQATNTTEDLNLVSDFAFDRADVWVYQNSGNGEMVGGINGGAKGAAIPTTGSQSQVKKTVSVASAVGTLNLARNGVGGGVYPSSIELYDTATPMVNVAAAGWPQSKTNDWISTSGPYGPLNQLGNIAADTYILGLLINDMNAAKGLSGSALDTAVATFKANYRLIINKCLLSGDVIMLITNPSDPTDTSTCADYTVQAAFVQAMYDLAAEYTTGVAIVDVYNRFGTWAAANAVGFMADSRHPIDLGYDDIAAALTSFFRTLM